MEVLTLSTSTFIKDELIVTIGQFDGIHKAHQILINKAVLSAKEKSKKSAVITFNPHIDTVLKGKKTSDYIIDFDSKVEILNSLNVDYLLVIDFNKEVSKISHTNFFKTYINKLNIKEFVVGFDFSYGYLGIGKPCTIQSDYEKETIVTVVDKQESNDEKIGSLEIKKALNNGDIKTANILLGYQFFMNMKVTKKDSNRIYLESGNLNILKNQCYNVLINNCEYILTKENQTYIDNIDSSKLSNNLKVTFK